MALAKCRLCQAFALCLYINNYKNSDPKHPERDPKMSFPSWGKRREYNHLSSPKDGGTTTAEHNESEGSSLSMIVCDQKTAVRPLISPNLGLPSALLLVPSWFPRPLLQDRPFGMRGGFECSTHWPLLHQKRSRD